MTANYSELAYRAACASGATHIGLLLLVYDALASDFQRAAEALSRGDIAARCTYSNHALLLLGHLEQWCALLDDDVLATSLKTFYTHLRTQLLWHQASGTPESFSALASLIWETRAVWQLKEQRSSNEGLSQARAGMPKQNAYEADDLQVSSWSA